jgi:hypothetical protein
MGQILVRKLEGEVIDDLKSKAKSHGRSLEAEVRQILREATERPVDSAKRREIIENFRKRFEGRRFSDSTELIREDRDR